MEEMKVVTPKEVDVDKRAMEVFNKAIELIGGPRKLVEYRQLTWLPSLMAAAYAVVLSREGMKTEESIAEFLGTTKQTVRLILQADEEAVKKRLEQEGALATEEAKKSSYRAHTAGALAKLAYKELKAEE